MLGGYIVYMATGMAPRNTEEIMKNLITNRQNIPQNEFANVKPALIAQFDGYRHNEYDGFDCSWGIICALGGTSNASGNEISPEMQKKWDDGIENDENFYQTVLANLDGDFPAENLMEFLRGEIEINNGEHVHLEQMGCEKIKFTFSIDPKTDKMFVNCDDDMTLICKFY